MLQLCKIICFLAIFKCALFSENIIDNGWEHIGPGTGEIGSIYFENDSTIIIPAIDNAAFIYFSSDYGTSWDSLPTELPSNDVLQFMKNVEGTVFTGVSHTPSLYISEDNGRSWVDSGPDMSGCYSLENIDSTVILGAFNEICRSEDLGKTWTRDNLKSLLGSMVSLGCVYSMTKYDDILYAGTNFGVIASLDTGKTWIKRGLNLDGVSITSICFIDTVMLVGTDSGIWRNPHIGSPEDFFTGWELILRGKANVFAINDTTAFSYVKLKDTTVTYISHDTANTWEPFSYISEYTGINNIYSKKDFYYIPTYEGVWRYNKKQDSNSVDMSVVRSAVKIPISFLQDNIEIRVNKNSAVTIRLFSPQGRLIKKNSMLFSAGTHNIPLKKDISAGMYLVSVTIDGQQFSKQITIK